MSTAIDQGRDRTGAKPGTVSEQLAQFVSTLTLSSVPDPVVTVARMHLLDGLGIGLASTGMDFAESVHRAATRLGHGDEARAMGYGTALPAASAALVNGTLIHGLDFDDTHVEAIYHATAPALATALAIGEAEHARGADLLIAYIVGLEVGCRISAAAQGRFHDRGFHPTGIAGTFAAACAAAKLRGHGPDTLVDALGICASQAAGTLELGQSWLKRLHPGWAAHSGISATTLAGAGFRGPTTTFDGPRGLYASHLGDAAASDGMRVGDLGTRWMCTDIAIKPYPCCHFTHAFIDAALQILTELGRGALDPDDVTSIVCPTSERVMPSVTEPADKKISPDTLYNAQFSVQYTVAYALVHGRVDLATFYDESLDHPAVLDMASKVSCPPDPDSDFPRHFPGEVIVHLAGGETLRRRVPASSGTVDNPLPSETISRKFRSNAERTVAATAASAVATMVDNIEELDDITALLDRCTAPGTR